MFTGEPTRTAKSRVSGLSKRREFPTDERGGLATHLGGSRRFDPAWQVVLPGCVGSPSGLGWERSAPWACLVGGMGCWLARLALVCARCLLLARWLAPAGSRFIVDCA
jgi:hypothetical protein